MNNVKNYVIIQKFYKQDITDYIFVLQDFKINKIRKRNNKTIIHPMEIYIQYLKCSQLACYENNFHLLFLTHNMSR